MRVPEAAANSTAKVTLSFGDWKEGRVAPATVLVPVVEETLSKSKSPQDR